MPLFGGGLRDIELVPWNFAQMRFIRQSAEAARLLEGSLRERVPLVTPAVASAPFRVLESANMPALLIEVGYLSNPSQEKQLANSDFQTVFSQAVVDAITSFRDQLAAGDGAER